MSRDLSVLIPARHEAWLRQTVEDVLAHSHADTEVIVVCDGSLPVEPLAQHPRVQVVLLPTAIGQRAATNLAARISTARYVMKLDAHCAVADGFDVALLEVAEALGPDVTQIPAQKNLHVYSWRCDACGYEKYQGPDLTVCPSCAAPGIARVMVWRPRPGTTTTAWSFTAEPKFQYGGAAQPSDGDIRDVMSSLGACFFMARERYWALGGLDESHGSWGSLGIEVACKSWLSGGRHVVNTRTWFAHFFRVGGINFPYPMTGTEQAASRTYARSLWFDLGWPGQVRPLSWLVEKFWPVRGWTEADRAALRWTPARQGTVGLVYYTDNQLDPAIADACLARLTATGLPLVAVSLQPLAGVAHNVVVDGARGPLTMFRQILAGLEALDTEHACLVEHDVLYTSSYFDFVPPTDDAYYYNLSWWKVDVATGRAVTYEAKQTSQLCASRALLIRHYRERIRRVEAEGFSRRMGFEPGSHGRAERVDDVPARTWRSAHPNIDLRHGQNLTPSRWRRDQFRDQRQCQGWTEADVVPGWGPTRAIVASLRAEALV